METTYLRKIHISNFRPFGESFDLSLPGPGVTLLVGPNGLGKSSFFDAIEWGLTGQVARLSEPFHETKGQDIKIYYARRLGDGKLSKKFRVRLQFDDGDIVREDSPAEFSRISSLPKTVLPGAVVKALVSPAWGLPLSESQIGLYLHQTHIMSQTPVGRFLLQDADERWGAIRGPAGTERLSLVLEGLGQGTKRSLTERRKGYESAVNEAKRRLAYWSELLAKRQAAQERAAGGGALSPQDATNRLPALERTLDAIPGGALGGVEYSGASADPSDLNMRLRLIVQRIESAERYLAGQHERFSLIEELPRAWISCQAEQNVARAEVANAEAELIQLSKREEQARSFAEQKLSQIKSQTAIFQKAQEDSKIGFSIAARLDDQKRLQEEYISQGSELRHLEGLLSKAREDALSAQRQHEALERNDQERKNATLKLETYKAASSMLSEWRQRHGVIAFRLPRKSALAAQQNEFVTKLQFSQRGIIVEKEQLEQARIGLAAIKDQTDTILKAVAEIAGHLKDWHQKCPVCLTQFESGVLRTRVATALKAEHPKLAELEQNYEQHKHSLHILQEERIEIEGELTKIADELQLISDEERAVELLWSDLIELPVIQGVGTAPSEIETHLSLMIVNLEESIRKAAESGTTTRDMLASLENARAVEQIASGAVARCRQRCSDIERQLQECKATLTAHQEILVSLDAPDTRSQTLGAMAASVEVSRKRLEECESELRLAQAELQNAQETRVTSERQLAKRSQFLQHCTTELATILQRWTSARMEDEPDDEPVKNMRQDLDRHRQALESARLEHHFLSDGLTKWDLSVQLTELSKEINAWLSDSKTPSESHCTDLLRGRIANAEQRLGKVDIAYETVLWLEDILKDKVKSYIPSVLEPINRVAANFLDTLSVFPGQSVVLETKPRGATFQLGLRLRTPQPNLPDDLSPLHVLSQGQLTAVSLSLLLSMSTIYRWSRWRALLLDDPLQYADIIHVAAFTDIIRNLVIKQKYQIVLSTHDLELAEFLQRKFLSANVPYKVCRFIAPGSHGVITDQA